MSQPDEDFLTDIEAARLRLEELATYDREQRRYRTPPGLVTVVSDEALETAEATRVAWLPADPEATPTAADVMNRPDWVDVGSAQIADLMGLTIDHVEKAMRDIVDVINRNAEAIREANEALERLAEEPDRRRGRTAQASPYDIGRKR